LIRCNRWRREVFDYRAVTDGTVQGNRSEIFEAIGAAEKRSVDEWERDWRRYSKTAMQGYEVPGVEVDGAVLVIFAHGSGGFCNA